MLGCVYNDVFRGVAQGQQEITIQHAYKRLAAMEANTVMETMGMDMVTG